MKQHAKVFYALLGNNILVSITNSTVWFALTFFVFLETQSVFATSIISGLYLVLTSASAFWFGSLVDHHKKKDVMLVSSLVSVVIFALGFGVYITAAPGELANVASPRLWLLAPLLLAGVIAGNVRSIAMPTLVSMLFPARERERANGLVGTAFGISFLMTSVFSGLLVGHSGMYLVLILAMVITLAAMLHLWTISVPEKEIVHLEDAPPAKVDVRGTFKLVRGVPGLLALILFTTFNNFLGGVFMALMDAYGLSLVSVEVWGFLWGGLSTAFIIGGLLIARFGLGGQPLRAMFTANIVIWMISSVFTIQPSIVLLAVGCFIYLCVVPFIEAAEHTIIQKVVPVERQGRVFGFAQSIESLASPLTAFFIGPIAQFIFIPFMTTGAGVQLIGEWFGAGPDRGIALVFIVTGVIGLMVTLIAMRSKPYQVLAQRYAAAE
ncbi:MAG: MFS transporter [Anaerolineales bacterium]|nr:MFS transporter [Anaerolineales bacterium]MCW5855844.1 MFS transporter [Anaerolineales bacterium]